MAARAQIVIEVDDSGVLRATQRTAGEFQKLGPALQKAGTHGNVVMTQLAKDHQRARDAANLLNRTLGVEMPRSMERIILQSPRMQKALASAFNISVVATMAAVLANLAVEGIGKLIEWWNKAEDAKNKALEIDQQRLNKVLIDAEQRGWQARLAIQKIGLAESGQLHMDWVFERYKLEKQLDEAHSQGRVLEEKKLQELILLIDKEYLARRGDARKREEAELLQQRIEREMQMAAAIAAGPGQMTKILLEQMKSGLKAAEGDAKAFEARMDAAAARAQQRAEEQRRITQDVVSAENQAAIATLSPWEQTYAQIVESARQREMAIRDSALSTSMTEAQAARLTAAVWAQAGAQVRNQLASDLERAFDDLTSGRLWEVILRQFKHMVFQMIAQWILGQRTMQAATAGASATQGGGFSLGGMLGGLFGIGGGGGGFALPGGSAGGMRLPAGVSTTFPSGGGMNLFSNLTAPSAVQTGAGISGLFGLPISAGGGGFGGSLPAGSAQPGILSAFRGNPLSAGQGLLAGGIASAGLMGGRAVGFGGPASGALAGGLMGAGLVGAGIAAAWGSAVGSAGAAMGALLLGPVGIAIIAAAALIGLLFGVFGRKKKQRQRDEIERQAFRAIEQVETSYKLHQTDYNSAIVQLEQIRQQTDQQMAQLKWPNRMHPHINAAIKRIGDLESERQRRMQLQGGGPMFAQGGFVSAPSGSSTGGFGPLGIPLMPRSPLASRGLGTPLSFDSGGPVPIIAHAGEFVVRRKAVERAGRGAMERLNATGEMAGGGTHIHFHIETPDPPSFVRWLRNGGIEQVERERRRYHSEGGF